MKKLLSKFNKLSSLKKIALLMFILFGLFWYWATRTFYYYIIHTLGLPKLSAILGVSIDTIDWLLFRLPFYFKIICSIIFLPIISIIIIKKKRNKITT